MKIAKIMLAGTTVLTIVGSAALAQQPLTGRITKLDRLNGTVAIQQSQSGTVGANTGDAAEEFKSIICRLPPDDLMRLMKLATEYTLIIGKMGGFKPTYTAIYGDLLTGRQ